MKFLFKEINGTDDDVYVEHRRTYNNNKLNIIDIKEILTIYKGIRIDNIILFKNNEKYKDTDEIELNPSKDNIFYYNYNARVFNTHEYIKIIIEYFQNNIDKVIFELNVNSSIFLLKYLIKKKLNVEITEQVLVDMSIDKKKILDDEILDNYKYIEENNKLIKLQLIKKGVSRFAIGIDFSFALMRNLNKVEFDKEAPSYREVSDGFILFCYCKNFKCKIYNQMNAVNLGYGKFDLIKEISVLRCKRCNDKKKLLQVRNMGFINCEWNYKGLLFNKKNSFISGDGVTIENKLYTLNETNINSQIEKMDIIVKELTFKYNLNTDDNTYSSKDNSVDCSIDIEDDQNMNKNKHEIFDKEKEEDDIEEFSITSNMRRYDNMHKVNSLTQNGVLIMEQKINSSKHNTNSEKRTKCVIF